MRRVDRLVVLVDEGEARVELVAKRMVRDHDAAEAVDHLAQFAQLVDAADVLVQAEDADVAHLGGHFHPAQAEHAGVRRDCGDLLQVPDVVMLGDTHGADSDCTRALDQILRREIRVGAPARGVQMEIDSEVGPSLPSSCGHDASYFGGSEPSVIFLIWSPTLIWSTTFIPSITPPKSVYWPSRNGAAPRQM